MNVHDSKFTSRMKVAKIMGINRQRYRQQKRRKATVLLVNLPEIPQPFQITCRISEIFFTTVEYGKYEAYCLDCVPKISKMRRFVDYNSKYWEISKKHHFSILAYAPAIFAPKRKVVIPSFYPRRKKTRLEPARNPDLRKSSYQDFHNMFGTFFFFRRGPRKGPKNTAA